MQFISEDPAGFVDGTNLYAYVGGNPIKYVDPTGYLSVLVGGEATAAFGGGVNAAGGIFITDGGSTGGIDAGLFVSGGGSVGAAASASGFVTFLKGGRENINGTLETASFSAFGVDLEIHKAPNKGFAGISIGYGAGGGVTFDKTTTSSFSIRDGINAGQNLINRSSSGSQRGK